MRKSHKKYISELNLGCHITSNIFLPLLLFEVTISNFSSKLLSNRGELLRTIAFVLFQKIQMAPHTDFKVEVTSLPRFA